MVTVSELQVGDGARVRVDVNELRWGVFHQDFEVKGLTLSNRCWIRSNYFWTVFLSHD